MRTSSLMLATLLVAAALAGCTSNPPATTTPTTTTPTQTTPTTTTSPTVTPPTVTPPTITVPTLPPINVTAGIGRVIVLAAPDRAAPGSSAQVCWRVEGAGEIPHTAIHYDAASHPNATAFTEYAGGAMYPDNATSADPAGYRLPGAFCTNVPVGTGTLYFRAHALNPPNLPGTLSAEQAVWSGAEPAAFDLVGDVPALAMAGTNATVCWQTDEQVPHTAIHYDTVSHPNSTAFGDYVGGAIYPGNATSAAASGYAARTHCAAVPMPPSGSLYFRAHKLDPGNATDNLTMEKAIVVAPAVSLAFVGERAADGMTLVCWRVEGQGTVPHTAIHWDTTSHPYATAFTEYGGGAVYPGNATAAAASGYALPGPFCASLDVDSGTRYYRAHVLVPGVRNELSAESAIAAS